MDVKSEKLREEFSRDTFWTRIHIQSDDGSKKTTILVCASHEYLWDLFKARDINEVDLDAWFHTVLQKWSDKGDNIFTLPVHYDVYAETPEGRLNGLEFLTKEITP